MRQEGKSRREGTIEKRREESEICLTIAFLLDGKIGEKEGGEREAGRQLASGANSGQYVRKVQPKIAYLAS